MEEAWTELCDIIVENPKLLSEKLALICKECPKPKLLIAESTRVSRVHLNAILAVARIISKNVDTTQNHGKTVMMDFLQAVPKSFHYSVWPYSFTLDSISAFYNSFLSYVSCQPLEFGTEVMNVAISCGDTDSDISRAFLVALSKNFPSITKPDGDKLTTILLDQFADEDETIESLEKQEIAFKLITLCLSKVKIDSRLHVQVRSIAKRQLQSMSTFLKSRRSKQDRVLESRVNAKLFVYQAAAKMEFESLLSLEKDGWERLVMETLTLLSDACLTSMWRKMKAFEELFSSLFSGIVKISLARGGQPLGLLFIRIKPLPDIWVRNRSNIFESVTKITCEIIESS